MSKKGKIYTNEEIQIVLSEHIQAMDDGTADTTHTKAYFTGVGRLLGSVKLDIDGAKQMGVPLFKRTQEFLGIS